MKRSTILVVGCGFPQLGLIRFCKAEGLRVVGADLNPTAVGVALCDAFAEASTTQVVDLVRAAVEHEVDGITTAGSEHALLPTAIAAREAGLSFYADPHTLLGFRTKTMERQACRGASAPVPGFVQVSSLAEAQRAVLEFGMPVVVKPARGWGQRGVRIVRELVELAPAVRAALAASANAGQPDACLVEEFVEGREFSVNAYTLEGATEVLAVTERIITGYPDPPGITHAEVYPPNVTPGVLGDLSAATRRAIAALGIQRGPTYTQLRHDGRGAYVIETAHRCGGGLDPEVTYLASGVSLYRKLCGAALGRPEWERAGPEASRHAAAIGRFLVGRPGRVTRIEGLNAARGMPGVLDAEVYVGPGETVHPLTDGSKRVGHVVVAADSRHDAEQRAELAGQAIQIHTEVKEVAVGEQRR